MTSKMLSLQAPAKINLYLKILGRRADGYHELETLMQKVALYDELDLTLAVEPGVRVLCPDADLPEDDGNIVVRAAQLFLSRTGNSHQGVEIALRKNIPVAAGLGGGSSDAAAVLLGLNQLMNIACPIEELADMGVRLGADVPFFVYDYPAARGTGIGGRLEPAAPLKGYQVLLVNPGISVSTRWAYTAFSSAVERNALTSTGKTYKLSSPSGNKEDSPAGCPALGRPSRPVALENDLEQVTAERYSVICTLKDRLVDAGAVGAMMSGSGATVFGLFDRAAESRAETCFEVLKKEYAQVYLVSPIR